MATQLTQKAAEALAAGRAILQAADDEGRALTDAEKKAIDTQLEIVEHEKTRQMFEPFGDQPVRTDPGNPQHSGKGLFGAIKAAGWDRRDRPAVMVPAEVALGKTASFDGNYEDARPQEVTSPALAADERFLYPLFPQVLLDDDATAVQSFRQKDRTFPSPISGVWNRAIDAVTAKPEVDTESELVNEPLHQIAVVETGVANVMIASREFASWIQNDLRLAYRFGVDDHCITAIAAANPGAGSGTPANIYEEALQAQEAVAANGYNGSTLVLSPADALALRLVTMTGGDSYAFSQGVGMRVVATPTVADGEGFVLDPSAAGTFYTTNARFAAFEEDAGSTNSSTIRFESNGVFIVQRVGAIALLEAAES